MSAPPTDGPPVAPVTTVTAITVDLDDTLFPHSAWLVGAWRAVANNAGALGLDADALYAQLLAASKDDLEDVAALSVALAAIGVDDEELGAIAPGLYSAFRAHAPQRLECFPGVEDALANLQALVPIACVTGGDPHVQRAKLRALGLRDTFDAVVFSADVEPGHLGSAAPFARALELLGVEAAVAVHVGRRPRLDLAAATAAGMRAVWVRGRTGQRPERRGGPWPAFDSTAAALAAVAAWV